MLPRRALNLGSPSSFKDVGVSTPAFKVCLLLVGTCLGLLVKAEEELS